MKNNEAEPLFQQTWQVEKPLGITKIPKNFKLSTQDIKPLALGYGACFATDMITVEGKRVGFMYRQRPDNEADSGWRFLSAFEGEAYTNDINNLGIYDCNIIANYDPDIVKYLSAPVGAAFERQNRVGAFIEVYFRPQD